MNAISIASHKDLSNMIDEYDLDSNFKDGISVAALGKTKEPFHVNESYLLYGNGLCVTHNMRNKVMYESHGHLYAGHRGIQATLKEPRYTFTGPL